MRLLFLVMFSSFLSFSQGLEIGHMTTNPSINFNKKYTIMIEHKIAMIPLSSFYHNKKDDKLLRICFAKQDETLIKAAEILNTL